MGFKLAAVKSRRGGPRTGGLWVVAGSEQPVGAVPAAVRVSASGPRGACLGEGKDSGKGTHAPHVSRHHIRPEGLEDGDQGCCPSDPPPPHRTPPCRQWATARLPTGSPMTSPVGSADEPLCSAPTG